MNKWRQVMLTEGGIKDFIESLLPDEAVRFRLLSLLAQSIDRLHSHGASKWGAYCTDRTPDKVRLLSGMFVVFTIGRKGLWLSLDKETIATSDVLRARLETAMDWTRDTGEQPGGYGDYSLLPSMNIYYYPGRNHDQNWPPIRDLHFAFLDRVARKYRDLKTTSQHTHQPALLAYLRTFLNRDVPEPRYPSAHSSDPTGTPLEQTAERFDRLGEFDATSFEDARQRVVASIVRRRGQPAFRRQLLDLYAGTCAFSGCALVEVLDAAHIIPYQGDATNHPQNGLLLRTDLHTLFDLGLLAVDTTDMTIIVAPSLKETEYAHLSGKEVRLPLDPTGRPSVHALDKHRKGFVDMQSGTSLSRTDR